MDGHKLFHYIGEMACDIKLPIQSLGQVMFSAAVKKKSLDRLDLINVLGLHADSYWMRVHWIHRVHDSSIKRNDR